MAETQLAPDIQTKPAEKEELSYREVPYNIQLEQQLLGAVLTDNNALNQISDFFLPEHFYVEVHQRIFAKILEMNAKGMPSTPVTLKAHFDSDPALETEGGAGYLVKIAGLASNIINVKEFATILHNYAISRDLIHVGENIVNTAYDAKGDEPANRQIEVAEQELFNLANTGVVDRGFTALSVSLTQSIETANAAAKREDAISGVPTGFIDLDKFLGGMQKSDLIILAARPSMGKTALAMNLAINGCKALYKEHEESNGEVEKKAVGFFSLEMSSEQLATRLLSMETGIGSNNIRRGNLKKGQYGDEFEKLVRANQELYQLPLFIDDTPALSISAVRTRARRLKRKHNLGLLVIDYLQLLRGTTVVSQNNRVQEVSEITMGLKAIAKELDIPVIALSQLSRKVEERDDKRPQLADLRESGSIEQDADIVLFLYRAAYYKARQKPQEGTDKFVAWQEEMDQINNLSEVIISKHRNGPIGTVELHFDGMTTKFSDLIKDEYLPEHHDV